MVEEFVSTRALAWRRVRRRPLGALPRHTLGVLVMLRPRPALPIAWRSLTSARLSPRPVNGYPERTGGRPPTATPAGPAPRSRPQRERKLEIRLQDATTRP